MSGAQPTDVEGLVAMMGGLMDALHQMIDMNTVAMSRTWWLAEQLGVETPESSEVVEDLAERLHHLLFKWEEEVTGLEYVAPPARGTPGGSAPPAEIEIAPDDD